MVRKPGTALFAVLLVVLIAACDHAAYYPPVVPGGEGELGTWVIDSLADLHEFASFEGNAKAVLNLKADPESGYFPMALKGTKEFSGSLEVGKTARAKAASASSKSSGTGLDSFYLFTADGEAGVTFSDFNVSVDAAVADIVEGVIEINGASSSITVINYKAEAANIPEGETAPEIVGISIGAKVPAANVSVDESSKPGYVKVSPENEDADTILKDIETANPSVPVSTKYEASDAGSLLKTLGENKRAVLVQDIRIDSSSLTGTALYGTVVYNSKTRETTQAVTFSSGIYDIDLNGHELVSEIIWNLPAPEADGTASSLYVHDGTLRMLNSDIWNKDNPSVRINELSYLKLRNVDFYSDITGLFFVNNNNNMRMDIEYSTITCDGYYGLGTNATKVESKGLDLNISDSTINVKGTGKAAGDTIGILFNVQGTVDIERSDINAESFGIIARGGTHTYTDTSFTVSGTTAKYDDFTDTDWKGGSNVPLAAIVIGDRSSSYPYPTTVHMENVVATAPAMSTYEPNPLPYHGVYVWEDDYDVTVSGDVYEGENSQAEPFVNIGTTNADITGLNIYEAD